MDSVQLLEQIRSVIRATFNELGGSGDQSVSEAMLIRDGFFCGRRFRIEQLQAVWFVEENEIKFYDHSGACLKTLELTHENLDTACRRAA